MLYLKRLFAGPPNTRDLRQQQDIAGLLAALDHTLAWVRRDAAETLGTMQEPRARAPLTAALQDRDAEVRHAAQVALDTLNAQPASRAWTVAGMCSIRAWICTTTAHTAARLPSS